MHTEKVQGFKVRCRTCRTTPQAESAARGVFQHAVVMRETLYAWADGPHNGHDVVAEPATIEVIVGDVA